MKSALRWLGLLVALCVTTGPVYGPPPRPKPPPPRKEFEPVRPHEPFKPGAGKPFEPFRPPQPSWHDIQIANQRRTEEIRERKEADIKGLIPHDPAKALRILKNDSSDFSGTGLDFTTRNKLEKEAIDTLVEQSATVLKHEPKTEEEYFSLLRAIRDHKSDLKEDNFGESRLSERQKELKDREKELQDRYLQGQREAAVQLAEKGKLKEAAELARKAQEKVPEKDELLEAVIKSVERSKLLEEAGAVLKDAAATAPFRLTEKQKNALPEGVSQPLRQLAELTALKEQMQKPWGTPPEVPALLRQLELVREHTGDIPLTRRMHQELSTKLFLEGHVEAANELLAKGEAIFKDEPPTEKEKKQAAALLRDLGAALDGTASVQNWTVKQVLQLNPGQTGHPTRGPPPIDKVLQPEAAQKSWRPPTAEDARDGLPTLPVAVQPTILKQVERVRKEQVKERDSHLREQRELLTKVKASVMPDRYVFVAVQAPASTPEDDKFIEEVEQALQELNVINKEVRFGAAEKVAAREARRKGSSATEFAMELLGPVKPEDQLRALRRIFRGRDDTLAPVHNDNLLSTEEFLATVTALLQDPSSRMLRVLSDAEKEEAITAFRFGVSPRRFVMRLTKQDKE